MKIQYYLLPNSFNSPEDTRLVAKVKKPGILDQEDLIHAMLYKNTTLTRQDILCVLDLMRETVGEKILAGYSVHTDLFRAGVSIRGDFSSHGEKFDRKKHRVCVNMNASLELQRKLAARAAVERVHRLYTTPSIDGVERLGGEREGDFFAPGDLLEVTGCALKREDGKSPVYLFPVKEGADWKRDKFPIKVYRVNDRSVLCQLPEDLFPGEYHLYVDSSLERKLPMAGTDEPLRVVSQPTSLQAE